MNDYGHFYRKWKNTIMNYLVRMTGDYSLSKDIMQEAFARHLKYYGPLNRDIPLIYRITRNLLVDQWRHRASHQAVGCEQYEEPSIDGEHHIMVRSEYRRILAAMERLETAEREILALVIGGDLSYKEISDIVGISVANVKIKVHRARCRLKEILKDGES